MSKPKPKNIISPHKAEPANPYTLLGELPIARDKHLTYQINEQDLDEHFYCIGRSGTGKSNLLIRLALADIAKGSGHCFIDPIGSTAEDLLSHIPTALDIATSRQSGRRRAMSRVSTDTTKTNGRRDTPGKRGTIDSQRFM